MQSSYRIFFDDVNSSENIEKKYLEVYRQISNYEINISFSNNGSRNDMLRFQRDIFDPRKIAGLFKDFVHN